MVSNKLKEAVTYQIALTIMGKNFFGPDEWSALYGVKFTEKQLQEIAKFPWSEDVLNGPCPFVKRKSIRETHFAFLGLNSIKGEPLTVLKWTELHPPSSEPKFSFYPQRHWYENTPDRWHTKERFDGELTCGFRWYLMPIETVLNSTGKTYQEQIAMLPDDYEVPYAVEEVTKQVLYYRKSGTYLKTGNRCQDVAFTVPSVLAYVVVGPVSWEKPVSISCYSLADYIDDPECGEFHYCNIGLAASRKL